MTKTLSYNRMLSTAEAAEEIGYNVTQQKLRNWRMEKDHPLPYYKKTASERARCYYSYKELQKFKALIDSGKYIP